MKGSVAGLANLGARSQIARPMPPSTDPVQPTTTLADRVWWRWALILAVALGIIAYGPPPGITTEAWRLLAIFLATIVGSIVRPVPPAAVPRRCPSHAAACGTPGRLRRSAATARRPRRRSDR